MALDNQDKKPVITYKILGHKEIDDQHFMLIAIVNQISTLVFSRTNDMKIISLLDNLLLNLASHFTTEEELMTLLEEPENEINQKHKQEHRIVVDNITRLRHDLETHILQQQKEFKDSVKFLNQHIFSYDSELMEKIASLGLLNTHD